MSGALWSPPLISLALAAAGPRVARAQEPLPAYEQPQPSRLRLMGDGLLRQEWTQHILDAPNQDRWRIQLRPRLELAYKRVLLAVGGEFNRSRDRNTEGAPLPLIRDNYRSRDARLDLAFARLDLFRGLRLEAGRFPMPVVLTEMIWDRDLRPQGASLRAGEGRFSLTAVGARGSHVFDDDLTEMGLLSAQAVLTTGAQSKLELVASWMVFADVHRLEPMIGRQNTRQRPGGPVALEYRVVDAVARLRQEGALPWQLVADACWNTAAEEDRRGLWLAVVVGSTRTARARAEYTFARVDKDATVAAYATDDFFWATGWEGHRGDLGIRLGDRSALHAVGQRQRFKDSARPEERTHWVNRYRLELRFVY